MLALAINKAKRKGYESVRILASKTNNAAMKMYEKLGYISVGDANMYDTDFRGFEIIL